MKGKFVTALGSVLTFALIVITMMACVGCGGPINSDPDPDKDGDGGNNPPAEVYVTDLEIVTPPDKVSYYVGEELDFTGMKLEATWSDGAVEDLTASDCQISKTGTVSAEDTKITFTYEGLSAEQTISVNTAAVASVIVNTDALSNKGAVNTPIDLTRVVVTVVYSDEAERVVNNYTLEMNGAKVDDPSAVVIKERGEYSFEYVFGGVKSEPFVMEIFNGFMIEAENIDKAEPGDKKNYVGGNGYFHTVSDPGGDLSSGGAYMGDVKKGDIIRFHIWSDAESPRQANLILRTASGLMTKSGSATRWRPLEMGKMQFNKVFTSKFGDDVINVDDSCVLEGGKAPDGTDPETGDPSLWVNWTDVSFGTVTLQPGDNIVELTVISDYKNCMNVSCACNIDRLEIEWVE